MWSDAGLAGVVMFIVLIFLIGLLTILFWAAVDAVEFLCERRAEARREVIEADLDRKQAELQRTVLALAEALADERIAALQASEQMVARAYLTTGRVP